MKGTSKTGKTTALSVPSASSVQRVNELGLGPRLHESPNVKSVAHRLVDFDWEKEPSKGNLLFANKLLVGRLRFKGFDINCHIDLTHQDMAVTRPSDRKVLVDWTDAVTCRYFIFGYETAVWNRHESGIHEIRCPNSAKFYFNGSNISPSMSLLLRNLWLRGYDEGKEFRRRQAEGKYGTSTHSNKK